MYSHSILCSYREIPKQNTDIRFPGIPEKYRKNTARAFTTAAVVAGQAVFYEIPTILFWTSVSLTAAACVCLDAPLYYDLPVGLLMSTQEQWLGVLSTPSQLLLAFSLDSQRYYVIPVGLLVSTQEQWLGVLSAEELRAGSQVTVAEKEQAVGIVHTGYILLQQQYIDARGPV